MRYLLTLPLFALALGCSRGPAVVVPEFPPEPAAPALTALPATGWGTLVGRVTLDGPVPVMEKIVVGDHPHAATCHSDELRDETWVVDAKSRGVGNVVVWLQAPKGAYFPAQPDERKTWADVVRMDQPKCAFVPRVVALFPQAYDPKRNALAYTGQVLAVRNDSPVPHEAAVRGGSVANPLDVRLVPAAAAGGKPSEAQFRLRADGQPLTVTCGLHRWMRGYAWAFDHPHAAVTNPDGTFELKNVPAGVEVTLHAWHEAGSADLPKGGRPLTVPAGGEARVELVVRRPSE